MHDALIAEIKKVISDKNIFILYHLNFLNKKNFLTINDGKLIILDPSFNEELLKVSNTEINNSSNLNVIFFLKNYFSFTKTKSKTKFFLYPFKATTSADGDEYVSIITSTKVDNRVKNTLNILVKNFWLVLNLTKEKLKVQVREEFLFIKEKANKFSDIFFLLLKAFKKDFSFSKIAFLLEDEKNLAPFPFLSFDKKLVKDLLDDHSKDAHSGKSNKKLDNDKNYQVDFAEALSLGEVDKYKNNQPVIKASLKWNDNYKVVLGFNSKLGSLELYDFFKLFFWLEVINSIIKQFPIPGEFSSFILPDFTKIGKANFEPLPLELIFKNSFDEDFYLKKMSLKASKNEKEYIFNRIGFFKNDRVEKSGFNSFLDYILSDYVLSKDLALKLFFYMERRAIPINVLDDFFVFDYDYPNHKVNFLSSDDWVVYYFNFSQAGLSLGEKQVIEEININQKLIKIFKASLGNLSSQDIIFICDKKLTDKSLSLLKETLILLGHNPISFIKDKVFEHSVFKHSLKGIAKIN